MNLSVVDGCIVASYLVGVLFIGIWVSRNIKNMADFSVGGRTFGSFFIFATLSASFIGGGFSFGNAEAVYRLGIINIFALWGFSLKEILVALFIAPKMEQFPDAISVGDILEKAYGRFAKIFSGAFSVILCAGILGAQIGGMSQIFKVYLGLPALWGIIIGLGIVVIYAAIGGMKAVVFTDLVQFIILSIGVPLTLILGYLHAGGIAGIKEAVPASTFTFAGSGLTITAFVSLFLTFVLGETLVPPYVQRLLIAKDKKSRIRGTLLSGIFSIPFFAISGAIGIIALAIKPDLAPELAMPYVIQQVLPIGMQGLVVAGVISILMSSADSFLNASAVALVHDIVKPLAPNKLNDNTELALTRIATIVTGIVAVLFATSIESLLEILVYSYNFWSPVLLVPLVATILGINSKARDFYTGAILGIIGVCIWNFALHKPFGIDGLLVGIVANATGFTLSKACFALFSKNQVSNSLVLEDN